MGGPQQHGFSVRPFVDAAMHLETISPRSLKSVVDALRIIGPSLTDAMLTAFVRRDKLPRPELKSDRGFALKKTFTGLHARAISAAAQPVQRRLPADGDKSSRQVRSPL
jgi:hypothetical protein